MGRAHSINESYDTLVRILCEPHRDRALLIASVNRTLNADILQFMQPFRKLFEVLQFNSKPTINFAVLTYYKAAALAKPCVGDNPIVATLKKEFTLLLFDRSFFAASLKAHHWLATFLDPRFKRFEFLPIITGDQISFKKTLLSDVDKRALQNMAEVAAKVPQTEESNPPEKRARLERSQDPFSDFRDGAFSNVNSNRLSTSFHDENILRQCVTVCFVSILHRLFRLQEQLLV